MLVHVELNKRGRRSYSLEPQRWYEHAWFRASMSCVELERERSLLKERGYHPVPGSHHLQDDSVLFARRGVILALSCAMLVSRLYYAAGRWCWRNSYLIGPGEGQCLPVAWPLMLRWRATWKNKRA